MHLKIIFRGFCCYMIPYYPLSPLWMGSNFKHQMGTWMAVIHHWLSVQHPSSEHPWGNFTNHSPSESSSLPLDFFSIPRDLHLWRDLIAAWCWELGVSITWVSCWQVIGFILRLFNSFSKGKRISNPQIQYLKCSFDHNEASNGKASQKLKMKFYTTHECA